ncbi:MAG: hypothetical protein JNL74_13230 [Fibrobacteres bacterium]|nr:hypothetical protein [Fibrobacterota bacterium]
MDTQKHLSRACLESIVCGDKMAETDPNVKEHLEKCEECSAYLAKAGSKSYYFHKKYPTWDALKTKERKKGFFLSWLDNIVTGFKRPALALGSIALILGVVIITGKHDEASNDLDIKGNSVVFCYLNGNRISSNIDTIFCKEGDTISFSVTTDKPVYYAVYYSDDNGDLERYLPLNNKDQKQIGKPSGENIPEQIILEKEFREEKIFVLTSTNKIEKFIKSSDVNIKEKLLIYKEP